MRHLWLDSGYNGRGKGRDWVQTVMGWTVEVMSAIHRFKRYWVPNDIPPDQIDWSKYLPTQVSTSLREDGSWSEHSPGCYSTEG